MDGTPNRVLRERGYATVSPPEYVTIGGTASPGRAPNTEVPQPGRLPYHRRRQLPGAEPVRLFLP